jgi:small-conductance mechanosensitive channel
MGRYRSYVDLQERYQQDMSASMAKVATVRAKTRRWRSILSLLIAVGAAAVVIRWDHLHPKRSCTGLTCQPHGTFADLAITYSAAAAFFIFGLAAAFGLSTKARTGLQPVIGQAHAAVLRYATILISLFVLLVLTLWLVGVSPTQLALGGAVTGVLLGIAAQQSLGNLFAGLVLLFARPFRVGDRVRFRAGALSGQIDGMVVDVSLTYVRLETQDGLVMLPNAQALAAAVILLRDEPTGQAPAAAGTSDRVGAAAPASAPESADKGGPAPSSTGPAVLAESASDLPRTSR